MFFNRNPTEKALKILSDQYLRFTRSHVRSKQDRLMDLQSLITHQMVKQIAFATAKIAGSNSFKTELEVDTREWLLIATNHVKISQGPSTLYLIGEFLIYMSRFDEAGDNSPQLLLENVSPPDSEFGGTRSFENMGGIMYYAHPHIHGKRAMFCMSTSDTDEILSHIVCGDMCRAFSIINSALHSYDAVRPFKQITYWPSRPLWSMNHESD